MFQSRTYVITIEKIESVWHQKEMAIIANKTVLVCDGSLYVIIGGQYEINSSRSLKILGW